MKKILSLFAVLGMVCLSSMALAEVTVGGTVQLRSRNFDTMSFDKNNNTKDAVDTQERIQVDVNAKSDKVKGKITIWNDFETWGNYENAQGKGFDTDATNSIGVTGNNVFGIREAWVSFDLPGVPLNVTGGHQLLMVGNGGFFRSLHYGSDAWVVSNVSGNNIAALVDVKITEGTAASASDDIDAYVLLDVLKLNENMALGVNLAVIKDKKGVALPGKTADYEAELQNLGVTFNGKLGPVVLKSEIDQQFGKAKGPVTDKKYKGSQIIVQGNVPMDPVTINFLLGYGSGKKTTDNDRKEYVNFLDIDPHYTFLYEYKLNTACGARNTGFCNTFAISAGAMFAATKSLNVGLDIFQLTANEKITNGVGDEKKDIGMEIDAKVQWKLYDNLSWNWDIGYFKPGDAFKTSTGTTDAATGIQGILAYKF